MTGEPILRNIGDRDLTFPLFRGILQENDRIHHEQKMKYPIDTVYTPVNVQPVFHLVELFEETIEYVKNWRLPFNSLSLCVREAPSDPSWIDLPEKKTRLFFEKNIVTFITCDTPMRIRYTTANLHLCIHFRYELFPGVDLFSGIREGCQLRGGAWAGKIRAVFSEQDPLKRLTRAEAAAMDVISACWPEHLPLDPERMAQFSPLLQYVSAHLDNRMGIPEMAAYMGWSEAYFSRTFRSVFHITPKQYLIRELCGRAIRMLNNPQQSIKEIASELKFSSEFNFSRFIRNYCGFPPSALRRRSSGLLHVRK